VQKSTPPKKGPQGSVAHFLVFSSILSLIDGVSDGGSMDNFFLACLLNDAGYLFVLFGVG
jgi:hypothetical protein